MSTSRTKAGYLSRNSEGKFWYRIGETDGVIDVAVLHAGVIRFRRIRRSDYDHTDCYPHTIPSFNLTKEFK